jgi:adenylate cyclase
VATTARDWLIEGAPGAITSQDVFAGTCVRLVADGVPVKRAEAYVRTLHPQFAGRAFVWDESGVHAMETEYGMEALGAKADPIELVLTTKQPLRARLAPSGNGNKHLDEMAALGMTDGIGLPMVFTSGDVQMCAFLTDHPEGFSDVSIATLLAVMAPLSRMAEILALRRTATNVLTAYVGRDAGARVLAGKIRRGDTELIDAAIWFSDMRGFSAMSNQRLPHEVIATLNELFDCQLPAIERHGGEVLKFMGDGLLAIFTPRGRGEGGLRECCDRALAASRDAVAAMHVRGGLRFGIALHVGEVAYGNIGGEARLDFTCIGRAVNLAARIESLTSKLAQDVLASEEFVKQVGDGFDKVGDYEVKGFAHPVATYRPRDI